MTHSIDRHPDPQSKPLKPGEAPGPQEVDGEK